MTNTTIRQTRSLGERRYPDADASVNRFMNKLIAQRDAGRPGRMRATSSALIKDEYDNARTLGRNQMQPKPLSPKQFDNNYSPYSNVNAEAVAEARRKAEEKRRLSAETRAVVSRAADAGQSGTRASSVNQMQSAQPMQTMPARSRSGASAVQSTDRRGASMQKSSAAESQRKGSSSTAVQRKRNSSAAVSGRRVRAGEGQLAETGPREVAVKRVPFPKLMIVILFLVVILFIMVYGFVRNYEYRREIADLQDKVAELSQRAAVLRNELDERDDYAYIEEQAKNLGMVKINKTDERYIDLSGADVIENFDREEDEYDSLSTLLSAIGKRLSRFIKNDQ